LPVRVLDARGRFVSGLTQSDFQVLEDGKPQSITAFSAFDIPFVPADSTVPDAPVAALDVVVSNDMPLVDGRVYLFVLDDFNTERGDTLKVRQLMHDFISQRLSANDLAAISMLGGARSQHFTRNRKLLHDAVDRFFGDLDPALPSRGHQALNSVARMAEWLGSIRGRRKALVLVTPSAICVIGADDCRESLQQALRTAVQSDVTVYTVDPRGLDTSRQSRAENNNPNATRGDPYQEATNGQAATGPFAEGRAEGRGAADGARYLAEESGGIAVVGTTAIERGLDRIVADSSAYYLLGYRSTNTRADGRFRRNQVKIARGDLRIVHRNGYFALRQEDIDDRPVRASVMAEMQDLARSPLPVSAMPLRASAASFLSGDGKARVAVRPLSPEHRAVDRLLRPRRHIGGPGRSEHRARHSGERRAEGDAERHARRLTRRGPARRVSALGGWGPDVERASRQRHDRNRCARLRSRSDRAEQSRGLLNQRQAHLYTTDRWLAR
jgi:VWFA-related protein